MQLVLPTGGCSSGPPGSTIPACSRSVRVDLGFFVFSDERMAEAELKKSMNLSIRLLREGRSIDGALRKEHELEEYPSNSGRLYVGQSPALPPTWLGFIQAFGKKKLPKLHNQSCAAVLFLEVPAERKAPKRIVALSFGTGHLFLDPDAFERSFGLRTVLNAVARSNLRGLDIATLDATTFQKRIQASRDADLQGFGIDIDRDLLRLASGSPRDTEFARSLAGKDALTLHTKTSSKDVIEKCKEALKLYRATDYKKDFGFIDFVSPVRQQDLLKELDALAFRELKGLITGKKSDLHLTLPDIISPEDGAEIGYFGAGLKSGQKHSFSQLAIEEYVEQLKTGDPNAVGNMAELGRVMRFE